MQKYSCIQKRYMGNSMYNYRVNSVVSLWLFKLYLSSLLKTREKEGDYGY